MRLGCNSDRNRLLKTPISIRGIVILLAVFLLLGSHPALSASSSATDSATDAAAPDTARSGIRADRTRINPADSSVEYIGNVIITQAESVITADNIKAFLKKSTDGELPLNEGSTENIGDSVNKLVATGNVKIVYKDVVVTGDEAVYDAATQLFVMTGDPATLVIGVYTSSSPVIEMKVNL